MADDESPRPFRRERNLSNRNFNKRGSRRRVSTESHSSVDSFSAASTATTATESQSTTNSISTNAESSSSKVTTTTTVSSSFDISYSVNSDTESAFNRKSALKMIPATAADSSEPQSPDPALLGVKQKVLRFETLKSEDRILFKTGKYQSQSLQSLNLVGAVNKSDAQLGPLRVLPVFQRKKNVDDNDSTRSSAASFHTSIDEERSEDDVDEFSDYAEEGDRSSKASAKSGEYILPEEANELKEEITPSPVPGYHEQGDEGLNANAVEFGVDDFGKVEVVKRSISAEHAKLKSKTETRAKSSGQTKKTDQIDGGNPEYQNFPRNYRSVPRPKTDIVSAKNRQLAGKCHSLYHPNEEEPEEEEEEIELRDKSVKFIQPILDELIKTEETYVENLLLGIANYGHIFHRKDLPLGLRGKKYVLLGNIEQLAEFHRDEFLPMLHRNRRDLKRLFDEFQHYVDKNYFYGYVIFTMNKQRSLKLCDTHKSYFKKIQAELDDKLGINSFLVQPIQRMARYPLLLQQFISTLFKNRDFVVKPLIESCCRLEKKLRTLLVTTNESEVINDIVDCNEFNVFYQGKFRKVSTFQVFDHTLKRSYRSKVFIFDKCIIYTEIKGKHLVFHGRYPCEHIGIVAKAKQFTLFYERRKQQECDFIGDPLLIELWLDLIRDMINSFVEEEKQKLKEQYGNDHLHRKPPTLSLYRDSNRFSSDSGIGNIWVMPKPEMDPELVGNRTTWYAVH